MHAEPKETLRGVYDEEEFYEDIIRVTGGATDGHLTRTMIRESAELLTWLQARGVRFQDALSGTLSLERTNAFFLGGGKALLNALYRCAERLGVRVFYDCEAVDLAIEDGRFESGRVSTDGSDRAIAADALVVASGGFQANDEWMKRAWGEAAENFVIRGTPYNTGTMLKCLMARLSLIHI